MVLLDILANAGGVTVSCFEWVRNRRGLCWTLEKVHARLKAIMETEGRLAEAIEAHGTRAFFRS